MKIIISSSPLKASPLIDSNTVVLQDLTSEQLSKILEFTKGPLEFVVLTKVSHDENLNNILSRIEMSGRISNFITVRLQGGLEWKCTLNGGKLFFLDSDAEDYSLIAKEAIHSNIKSVLLRLDYVILMENNPYNNSLYILITEPVRDEDDNFQGGYYEILSLTELYEKLQTMDGESNIEIMKVETILDETDKGLHKPNNISTDPLL